MHVVYIDSVFLLNLIINYLLLLVSARIVGADVKRLRLLAGSVVGALYAAMVWLPGMEALGSWWGKGLSALAIIIAAFARRGQRRLLRLGLVFAAVSFALGGCVLAVELLVYDRIPPGGVPSLPIDFKTLLLTAAAAYALLALVFRRAARHGPGDMLAVRVRCHGRDTELTALLDTGHSLTDPMTGAPVLIVEKDAAERILGFSVSDELVRDPCALLSIWQELARSDSERATRFRLVPYRAVGTEGGFLLAFMPEAVWLGRGKRARMLIALSPNPVSDGQQYHALIGQA